MSHYDTNLDKNNANFVPLTPLSFLQRAKDIYPNYEAIIYEDRRYTWSQVYKRCIKFASALEKIGIGKGDTVSVMAFNTPEIFEAHYSVPMTGAVLNTINSRVDAKTVAYILEHSEAKVLIVDRQLHSVIEKALSQIKSKPIIIDIQDNFADQSLLKKIGEKEYEEFIGINERLMNSGFTNFDVVERSDFNEEELSKFVSDFNSLLDGETSISKEALVEEVKKIVRTFNHIETGETLDNRM